MITFPNYWGWEDGPNFRKIRGSKLISSFNLKSKGMVVKTSLGGFSDMLETIMETIGVLELDRKSYKSVYSPSTARAEVHSYPNTLKCPYLRKFRR